MIFLLARLSSEINENITLEWLFHQEILIENFNKQFFLLNVDCVLQAIVEITITNN